MRHVGQEWKRRGVGRISGGGRSWGGGNEHIVRRRAGTTQKPFSLAAAHDDVVNLVGYERNHDGRSLTHQAV